MIHYEMPEEIRNYVLDIQAKLKRLKGNGKISQQKTISTIIREHKEIKETTIWFDPKSEKLLSDFENKKQQQFKKDCESGKV